MDKCDRCKRFEIVLNQVRGHCFQYFNEIMRQPFREKFFLQQNCKYLELIVYSEGTSVNSFKVGIEPLNEQWSIKSAVIVFILIIFEQKLYFSFNVHSL